MSIEILSIYISYSYIKFSIILFMNLNDAREIFRKIGMGSFIEP